MNGSELFPLNVPGTLRLSLAVVEPGNVATYEIKRPSPSIVGYPVQPYGVIDDGGVALRWRSGRVVFYPWSALASADFTPDEVAS